MVGFVDTARYGRGYYFGSQRIENLIIYFLGGVIAGMPESICYFLRDFRFDNYKVECLLWLPFNGNVRVMYNESESVRGIL